MQRTKKSRTATHPTIAIAVITALGIGVTAWDTASGFSSYKTAFKAEYPTAVGTRLDTLPSQTNHCGLCHYDFSGGGTLNAYGNRFAVVRPGFPSTQTGYRDALRSIENEDNDGDGFSNVTEIKDVTHYSNTPTFPGLTAATVASITAVTASQVTPYVTPIPPTCGTCRGDADGNGARNAGDIQNFVRCLAQGALPTVTCACADIDANGVLNQTDVDQFIAGLLVPAPSCP